MMSGSMFTVPPRGWWLACFSAYIRSEHVSTWFAQGRDRRDREAGKASEAFEALRDTWSDTLIWYCG